MFKSHITKTRFIWSAFILFVVVNLTLMGFYIRGVIRNASEINTATAKIESFENIGTPVTTTKGESAKPDSPYASITVDFNQLKQRNSDIVAMLVVDSMGLKMPVVQSADNEFYLEHDIDKKSSKLGWLFFDYRTSVDTLDFNSVIYGHNAASRNMFGNLKSIFSYVEDEGHTDLPIYLLTPAKNQTYKLVSVYVTESTDWKYTMTGGLTMQARENFVKYITERNQLKQLENSNITANDSFLTFSTCYGPAGTSKRLVFHAVLTNQVDAVIQAQKTTLTK